MISGNNEQMQSAHREKPKHIVITGASSGLGKALAIGYAYRQSTPKLVLTGRNTDRLADVAKACRNLDADVTTHVLDVTNRDVMSATLRTIDSAQPIDLLIANAGISGGTGPAQQSEGPATMESDLQSRAIFQTNLDGVLNTVLPIIPRMVARRSGQIALMGSLAGYRGQPGAPAYSASKAAVKVWGESLRGALAPQGVKVSVITPGFVETPMTNANGFQMPFLQTPEKAAEVIINGLERNRGRIAHPWQMAFGAWLLTALPDAIADRLTRRLPRKPPSASL